MNTDDRALADLIGIVGRAVEYLRRLGEDGWGGGDLRDAAYCADRLEAFHAKPGVVVCPVCKDAATDQQCAVCSGCGHLTTEEAATWLAALQSPPPVVSGEAIETAAIQLWHRWGSPDQLEWEDEPHKSEYRLAAKNILRALPTVSPFERAAQIAETFRPRGENAKHFVDQLVCDIAAAIRQEASNA